MSWSRSRLASSDTAKHYARHWQVLGSSWLHHRVDIDPHYRVRRYRLDPSDPADYRPAHSCPPGHGVIGHVVSPYYSAQPLIDPCPGSARGELSAAPLRLRPIPEVAGRTCRSGPKSYRTGEN